MTTVASEQVMNAIKSVQQIARYEGPQWLVSPQSEWEEFLDAGEEVTAEILDTKIIGWGPANAIVRFTTEGLECDFLVELGPGATIGMPYDCTFVTHMDYGNTWPLLDVYTLMVVGLQDENDPLPFATGTVRDGDFVEDENDNQFAVRA